MLGRLCGLPGVKKSENRFRSNRIYAIQKFIVQFRTCAEAFQTPFRFSFLVNAQQVAGIIPQKIWKHA